jgi:hypothetical protein
VARDIFGPVVVAPIVTDLDRAFQKRKDLPQCEKSCGAVEEGGVDQREGTDWRRRTKSRGTEQEMVPGVFPIWC